MSIKINIQSIRRNIIVILIFMIVGVYGCYNARMLETIHPDYSNIQKGETEFFNEQYEAAEEIFRVIINPAIK